jgi:hypothetical protein
MMALLMRLKEQGGTAWPGAPKALLLSPTHELAAQTARVLKTLLPGSGLKCCLLSKKSAGMCRLGLGGGASLTGSRDSEGDEDAAAWAGARVLHAQQEVCRLLTGTLAGPCFSPQGVGGGC